MMDQNQMLDRRNVQDVLRLTPLQEGILFEYLQEPQSERYCEQLCLQMTGILQEELLLQAWQSVVAAHGALRSVFRWEKLPKPVQIVLQEVPVGLTFQSLPDAEHPQAELEVLKRKDRQQRFDLQQVPWRVTVYRLEPRRSALLFSYHHIIMDGWSLGVVLRDLFTTYRLLTEGQELLVQSAPQYREFVRWLQAQETNSLTSYWQEYLAGYEPVYLQMRRETAKEVAGSGTYRLVLPMQLAETVQRYVVRENSTLPALFFSVWGLLLQKYMHTSDVVFGMAVSGRSSEITRSEEMVGLLINTLPLRISTEERTIFADLLRATLLTLQCHEQTQYVTLATLKRLCGLTTGNLFNVVIGFENYPLDLDLLSNGTSLRVTEYEFVERPGFDLAITVTTVTGVQLDFLYDTSVFYPQEIERLAGHFTCLLEHVIASPEQQVAGFELITPAERREILTSFNQPLPEWGEIYSAFDQVLPVRDGICSTGGRSFPAGGETLPSEEQSPSAKGPGTEVKRKAFYVHSRRACPLTLGELFLLQVQKTPAKVAVAYAGEELTYAALNARANQLAYLLHEKGVGPGTVVGLLMERSLEMVVGILGILKAGGAYLPLEPAFPEERLGFMLTDSGASILISTAKLLTGRNLPALETLDVETCCNWIDTSVSLQSRATPDDLAYIIYTSGSTGLPKGVMIEHRNAVSLFAQLPVFGLSTGEVWTLFHSYAFDFSVWEIFGALATGSKLVIVPGELTLDPARYYDFLVREEVTICNQTPSVFYSLIAQDEAEPEKRLQLRCVFLGGEALDCGRLQPFRAKYPTVRMINLYGATENTVLTAYREITDADLKSSLSNIGRPIPSMQIYILDQHRQLAPTGIPGELCIAGRGLARGYLNRPELTRERFVTNPFLPGERIYCTGDLARWLEDGSLEYLGRIDQQVKLRGYRIEVGEIQHRLAQYPGILAATVLAQVNRAGNPYLAAYFVATDPLDVHGLRDYLQRVLPEYMIPATFCQLEALPVTPNGKLDRKALIALANAGPEAGEETLARNVVEERIAAIWQEVLHLPGPPGVFTSFFALNGDSLNALQVTGRLERELGVKIPIQRFFQSPTVAELAQYVAVAGASPVNTITLAGKEPYYPLTFQQKRLWARHQIEPTSLAYNISGKLTLHEKVNEVAVQQAVQMLADRHAALRTRFIETDAGPVQVVADHLEIPVKRLDLRTRPGGMEEREQVYREEVSRYFTLEEWPLMYVTLLKVQEEEWDLIFTMHHIISDGWSVEILKREFALFYAACQHPTGQRPDLEALPIQYTDFAVWQTEQYLNANPEHPAYQYWKAQLRAGFPVVNLPYDNTVEEKSNANAGYRIVLPAAEQARLNHFAQQWQLTPFTVLFAAFNIALAKFTGQDELSCGIPSAGREPHEVQNLVGFFVNSVFLRVQIEREESFGNFCQRVAAEVLTALTHQHYPLEPILKEMKLRYPEIPVFFNMLNLTHGADTGDLESFAPAHIATVQDAKFDFILYVTEYRNGIELVCNYRSSRFQPATIEYMLAEYVKILTYFLQQPDSSFDSYRKRKKQKIF